ncbi:MAG: hypothetical protein PT965_05765 [Clostridia bacterium]|nr:hypothetical protein [Clostridia bacterium]MDY2929652.1 hypothetical protein [Clostridiaceae bacterium]
MDPLTELLTGLGRHYGLVLVGCAELIAALFLLGWRPRERRGRERFTAVSSVDRLMLSELYRQEEQVCLVLRRSDRMPLQAFGNLEGLLGVTLDRLRETMDALFSGLDRADELSELLLSLINDILDMSRIEAGKVELEAAPFSLRAFGSKLCDMFSKTLDAKDVRCDVRFDGMTADWVVGDELRIGQVVINFLSNAVKFTSQGEVTVTFRQML